MSEFQNTSFIAENALFAENDVILYTFLSGYHKSLTRHDDTQAESFHLQMLYSCSSENEAKTPDWDLSTTQGTTIGTKGEREQEKTNNVAGTSSENTINEV
jgi:hypothetical protein